MVNISSDSSYLESLEITNKLIVEQDQAIKAESKSIVEKKDSSKDVSEPKKDEGATEVNLSQSVLSNLNNLFSKEYTISKNLNSANFIYNSLADIRLELGNMLKSLRDGKFEHTIETLEEMDKHSNGLIEKVIKVVKENDTSDLVDNSYKNIFFEGLKSLKGLSLSDDNYFSKLDGIKIKVQEQENNYLKISEDLYSKLNSLSKEYEKTLAKKDKVKDEENTNSQKVQEEIVKNASRTLTSTCSGLTPEMVMGLLS